MEHRLTNWRTQIRKGYLELCLLALIDRHHRIYGFDLLEHLKKENLAVKEGTLYPLLNRMTTEGLLKASWETENNKGHPRKYYSLSPAGKETFLAMAGEFQQLIATFERLNAREEKENNLVPFIKEQNP